eukprot:15176249-Ditylum_brightwellii.AAC.1
MVINVPGAMHDSTAVEYGFIYEKLGCSFEKCRVKNVVDSAFSLKKNEFLIKSALKDVKSTTPRELVLNEQAVSVHQLSKWGMRGFQGSFPWTKDRFVFKMK